MRYSIKNRLAGMLAMFMTLAGAAVGMGQYPSAAEFGSTNASTSAVVQPVSTDNSMFAELEARIAELEDARRLQQSEPGSNGPIRDRAFRTVAEQSQPAENGDDVGGAHK